MTLSKPALQSFNAGIGQRRNAVNDAAGRMSASLKRIHRALCMLQSLVKLGHRSRLGTTSPVKFCERVLHCVVVGNDVSEERSLLFQERNSGDFVLASVRYCRPDVRMCRRAKSLPRRRADLRHVGVDRGFGGGNRKSHIARQLTQGDQLSVHVLNDGSEILAPSRFCLDTSVSSGKCRDDQGQSRNQKRSERYSISHGQQTKPRASVGKLCHFALQSMHSAYRCIESHVCARPA